MPAKISFGEAAEAVYDRYHGQAVARIKRAEFYELMRGYGIASSKDALRTLWAQAKFATWNLYDGPMEIILVDLNVLGNEVVKGGIYTYTYTHPADQQEAR